VVFLAAGEQLLRRHGGAGLPLEDALHDLADRYDLVLVESHQAGVSLPTVWLADAQDVSCSGDATEVLATLPWNADRPAALLAILEDWLPRAWRSAPVCAGVLIGGRSTRMGSPKHLLRAGGRSWLEQTVEQLAGVTAETVLLGPGEAPAALAGLRRLADVPDVPGPMAGILAALRWAPRRSWLIVACDLPHLTRPAVEWLLTWRRPGVWAAIPRLAADRPLEPLLAYYDFRARPLLEQLAARSCFRPAAIAESAQVLTPAPPADLAKAWTNVNQPEDLAGEAGGRP
jgi:molybdopterin-guanine dinucleotide biosynthesis protein A